MTEISFPWPVGLTAPDERPDPAPTSIKKRRGRRPAQPAPIANPTAIAWTQGQLLATGPAEAVMKFVAGARGPGVTPWSVDYTAVEEEAFLLAVRVPAERRSLSVQGCRLLARQLREAVEAHHLRVAAAVSSGDGNEHCPLDLHRLVPVPPAILALDRSHPDAERWLQMHWGVTELRGVTRLDAPRIGRRLPAGHAKVGFSFCALGGPGPNPDGWATDYPDVVFRLIP